MLILSQLVVVRAALQSGEEFWSCAGDGAFWHSFRETEAWQHSLLLIIELLGRLELTEYQWSCSLLRLASSTCCCRWCQTAGT